MQQGRAAEGMEPGEPEPRVGFRYFADKAPEAAALVEPNGRIWPRRELAGAIDRMTRAFRAAGLAEGNAVAIVSPNCAEFVVAYMAALQAGLLAVPINWHLVDEEIAFILEDSEARAAVVHESLGPKMLRAVEGRPGIATRVCIGEAPGFVSFGDFLAPHDDSPIETPGAGRMMAYTSATTGRPKGVMPTGRSPRESLARIVAANAAFGVYPEDDNVHLCASMLYHSAPLRGVELALNMGHRVVLCGRWHPELLLRLIETHRVTTTFMVPTMFVRLLKLPAEVRNRYATSSLRFVVHGAAPCPPEIKRRMIDWWGNVVWEAYGATEASGTIVSAQEWLERPGTVGRPMPGSDIKVLDESGRELPPFGVGLVYILPHTGEQLVYKGDPEKTRSSVRGQYVTAGDLGYLDEAGYLFLCGRHTDLIISAGMNIYPAEIEMALVQHPAVSDCAVVAEPHALLGEVPKAFVQVEPEVKTGPALTAALLRHLSAHLSAAKLPKRFEYVERVPRDPSGKLYKRLLE